MSESLQKENEVNKSPCSEVGPPPPLTSFTTANAGFYVLSGCSQPLIMTLCKNAGIADPRCQLYMVFYYLGPASVIFSFIGRQQQVHWPSSRTILKGCGIALFDIAATAMNYTGASLAGPTIFAIVYSSVTVWTALFSLLFLGRFMNGWQWTSVIIVFGGLTLTASDSLQLGDAVANGLVLVTIGSAMHALTYVMSEGIMTGSDERLSVRQNCAVQGIVACSCFLLWQLIYTIPRFYERILVPMRATETNGVHAFGILLLFGFANLVHATTFFHTLRHFPGGATSAGVMKGLQAVLVFVFTHIAYCGRTGSEEMCFTRAKFLSLVTVVGGVVGYGVATQERERRIAGYERIESEANVEVFNSASY